MAQALQKGGANVVEQRGQQPKETWSCQRPRTNVGPHGPKTPWTTQENHRSAQRMPAHDGTPKKADQQETTGCCHKPQREPNQKEEETPHINWHDTQSPHEDDNAPELLGLKGTPHRPDKPMRLTTPHDEGEKLVDTPGGGYCNP